MSPSRSKKVKIPGFRKGVVDEGRFEIAKTIVEHLKASQWEFSKIHCNEGVAIEG
jgi:hypothetical protein